VLLEAGCDGACLQFGRFESCRFLACVRLTQLPGPRILLLRVEHIDEQRLGSWRFQSRPNWTAARGHPGGASCVKGAACTEGRAPSQRIDRLRAPHWRDAL